MTSSLREPKHLEELLNYRLLRLQVTAGKPVVRLLRRQCGIARREWRLLALLAERGPMSPSSLSLEADLDRPRTSRALGLLQDKGLVQRSAQRRDERRALVSLTEAGTRAYESLFPQVAAINAQLVAALEEPTLTALDLALRVLTERARQLDSKGDDPASDRRVGETS